LFSISNELSGAIKKAASVVGEKVWEFPMHSSYEDDIKSDIADVKNVGCGRGAGSITAAMFLKKFISNDVLWAHLDIAAVSRDSKNRALSQKGATGFGVRLLEETIRAYCNC
jgi:leucyl aminopeptidase